MPQITMSLTWGGVRLWDAATNKFLSFCRVCSFFFHLIRMRDQLVHYQFISHSYQVKKERASTTKHQKTCSSLHLNARPPHLAVEVRLIEVPDPLIELIPELAHHLMEHEMLLHAAALNEVQLVGCIAEVPLRAQELLNDALHDGAHHGHELTDARHRHAHCCAEGAALKPRAQPYCARASNPTDLSEPPPSC